MPVVPEPRSWRPAPGAFRFDERTTMHVDPAAEPAAAVLREALGWDPPPANSIAEATVSLHVDPAVTAVEGYELIVAPHRIEVVGGDPAGAFYGVQTLRQLPPRADDGALTGPIPCVAIADQPHLRWRGVMLDVARHHLPVRFILRLIDLMALQKLNVLHLHLTDDQGWRFDVPAYPRLAEIAAWRTETVIGHDNDRDRDAPPFDGRRHGGIYTRPELRSIVAYARSRFVRVLPEVDMPGHMQAAIAAYPELGATGAPVEVGTRWGISETILDPGEPALDFCRTVLSEVMDIFPGDLVHCGGDEVPKRTWVESPTIQRRMRDLALPNEDALQGWFTRQIAAFLAASGRRLVGWDELLGCGDVPADAVIMAWRDQAHGVEAARAGHEVVMAPESHVYLDHYQARDIGGEPLAIGGFTPLEKVLAYDPMASVPPGASTRILGTEAQLWTEYIPTAEHAEYMLFPRLCAFAEAAWKPAEDRRDLAGFMGGLAPFLRRLDHLGVAYRPLDRGLAS